MKIIALAPVKNEEWILQTYITSMQMIADEIIILDDNSTDSTSEILRKNNIISIKPSKEEGVNMSQKRLQLLTEGRKRGGTHFIWLDADESFDSHFLENGRSIIEKMLPGQKLSLPWITLWKSTLTERIDGVWKDNLKDVIVFDLPEYSFESKILSEGRTQGPHTHIINLDRTTGVILHFQFIPLHEAQAKQAWYRCIEFLQTHKSARKINNTYAVSLDDKNVILQETKKDWFKGIHIPKDQSGKATWYISEIRTMFEKSSIKNFEPLDIWYVPELENKFILEMGRKPKPKIFPSWLIKLNTLKNRILK